MKARSLALTCWKDTLAVGSGSHIIILNTIIGSQVAALSGHTDRVGSLTFSLDGALLVSGSEDKTAKLWDLQTGGVIKTFCGHTGHVRSVSISPDSTTLASGSQDESIRLWGVLTGECFCVIVGHSSWVNSISFSPTNSQHLVSSSNDYTVRWWDINGDQIGPTQKGYCVTFSLDGTHFVSWGGEVATVRNSESGVVTIKLQASSKFDCCCFSPSGKLVAGSAGHTIYVWDITCSDPHLFKTFVGHTSTITALTWSSSLISASHDKSVKFWQIGASSTDPATTDVMSTPPTSTSIQSVSLQARKGIAISSDSDGVVKTWDISTGLCKASFQTPAKSSRWRDAQLIEDRLIFVWHEKTKICIWDTEKDELVQTVDTPETYAHGVRISEDGSKVFYLGLKLIQAWSAWTGEAVGKVEFEGFASNLDPLYADGSRIWVYFRGLSTEGWDFGTLGPSPIPLSGTFPNRPHLNCISHWQDTGPCRIEDVVMGTNIFQLVGRYAKPWEARWDGQYLVAGYKSGEVLILDFCQYLSRYM